MKKELTFILFLFLTVFLISCTQSINKNHDPPVDLIPRQTMVDIIVDLEIYDAIINTESKKKDNKPIIHYKKYYLYNSILEKYDITREQFNQSFEYYQNDLEFLDGMYADAITQLSKMKSEVDKEE